MKTFRIPRPCDPARLHDELAAAGVPVTCVRGDHVKLGEPAMWAVVVTADAADDAVVRALILAHVEPRTPSQTRSDEDKETNLRRLETL